MIAFSKRLVLVVAFTALATSASPAVTSAQADVSINIIDAPRPEQKWGYAPITKKVPVGTWVTWSNNGQDSHTVTADDGSFDSGNLDPSEGFSWYFDTPGTYTYACSWHAWMTGTIVVN